MAFIKLQFRPGVNRDQTNYSGEGGWYECDKIRFRAGYPEKLGGWAKYSPTSFYGTCRHLHSWYTTFSDNFLALGTNRKFYIESGGRYYDITPLRTSSPTMTTTNTDNCINTTNGSRTVTVNLGAVHSAETGSFVTIAGVAGASIGGIPIAEINKNHEITVVDTDTFTFQSTTAATSTTSNQGGTAITISFELLPGYASTTFGYGWGAGTWGRGSWGLGASSPIVFQQRDWFIDNFDNDLVLNYRNGAPYIWERGSTSDPATSLATRAIRLQTHATASGFTANDVPVKVGQLMVSQQDKHLIAFGAVPFGSTSEADFDPLLIRWASQDAPGNWTPAVTNSAGDLRLSRGSRIIRAFPTRQEILIWTDATLHTLQFLGTSDVFALQEYADNISIMSPRAMTSAGSTVYWMGKDKFYAYTGRVETLPCSLLRYVFGNMNLDQSDQVVCGVNEKWNEVWWFYPSTGSNWNDSYVVYNHAERIWYYGSMCRTAWLDTPLRLYPMAACTESGASTGYTYMHEYGLDDDGSAMEAYIQSSDVDLDDGWNYMLTKRIVPDIDFTGSTAATPTATMSVRYRNFPGNALNQDTANVVETSVGVYTEQVSVRVRARQIAFKLSSSNLGVHWQLGSPRVDARLDGRK